MSLASSPFGFSKRVREEVEEASPSGKRCRTVQPDQQVEQPQQAPPITNFASTLAQQRQEALERMEVGAAEKEDVEMDGNMSDSSTASNPRHPWNLTAPGMSHQHSTNSLSTSIHSSVASSMPTTPLDGSFDYTTSPIAYPSNSNPTSFTDMNGTTHTFNSSPPLSVYPALPSTDANDPFGGQAKQPMHNFTTTSGVVRIEPPRSQLTQEDSSSMMMAEEGGGGGAGMKEAAEEKPRILAQPAYGYGWDYPRQSNAFALGGHLV
ncbi:uncharacterized protein JCM6883_004478 [Sporobolomyces salmoneus]|uniref:uncharacterized protein n=1 Tax=Sporobolomyces salmoneus TaxID=183962 RepID=UPI003170F56E